MMQQPYHIRPRPSNEPVKVIYIMGSGRSGSTVLDMALGSMPGIVSTGELANLYVKTDFSHEYCSCDHLLADCPFWGRIFRELEEHVDFSQERYALLQQRYERLRSIPRLLSRSIAGDSDFQWYLRSTTLILQTARDVAGAAALVDSSKSPARALALSYSPDVELIPVHLVADPRNVVWSLQRAWDANPKAGIQHPIKSVSAVSASASWLATNWAAERIKHRLSTANLMRYEDFSVAPHDALEHILHAAGIPFVRSDLPAEIRPSKLHLSAGNRVRRQDVVVIQRDTSWLQKMPLIRKQLVRLLAWPLMRKYGYPLSPKSKRRRIILVIYSLGRGGAQRIITELANYWVNAGHKVALITFAPDPPSTYLLDRRVQRIGLPIAGASTNTLQALSRNISALKMLRSRFRAEKPDVILSFMTRANVLTLIAARGLQSRNIISERIDPREAPTPILWRMLRRATYRFAHKVVVQTESVRSGCAIESAAWRCVVIPNSLSQTFENEFEPPIDLRNELGVPVDSKIVIGIGRLMPQKGFDLLIKAFANCRGQRENWHLVIVGHGTERKPLLELSRACGVAQRTHLLGQAQSPRQLLQQSDLFVLSSRYEGFPNTLVEAMYCGVPVISFACRSGPEEIIHDNVDGILIKNGNVSSLTEALNELMSDDTRRALLGRNARRNIRRFAPAEIMPLWDELLNGKS